MAELTSLTLTQLRDGFRAGEFSAREIATSFNAAVAAARALNAYTVETPDDALAWSLQSQLWQRVGEPLRAVRAEAEWRAALGDVNGAIDRLRAGQQLARGTSRAEGVEATVIDARLRELERLRRELIAEERGG